MIKSFLLAAVNLVLAILYYDIFKRIVLNLKESIKEAKEMEREAMKENNQAKLKESEKMIKRTIISSILLFLLAVILYVYLSKSIAKMYQLSGAL